jgi:hypothetical protein
MSLLRTILGLKSKAERKMPAASEDGEGGPGKTTGAGSEPLGELVAFMKGMLECLATERIDQLTLREVITRFVEEKPERPYPLRGALLVLPHCEGKQVAWAFLDHENALVRGENGNPLGRKAICATLDGELDAMMAGRELLIVE